MASAKIFRINYKSDFILTLESDAGWMTPFCIKFWTGAPAQAFFAQWDGETYTHCAYDPSEPTKLTVQFDDHHLPIGDLKFQVAYHFTVSDFPNDTEDEVINPANITTEIDGETYQVMLDFTGETAPEIEFSLPAYANEAQRIANEQQRIAAETQRIANEETRIANEQTRQQNEQQRINQEQTRVNEYAGLKADAVAATGAANDAAALANQKAQLAADKAALAQAAADLANAKAQLASDKAALAASAAQLANDKAALAQQKAEYALSQGDYAKAQGDYAKEQGDTALADHQRAEADHGIAVDDHTQAGNDHTRAEADHGIAVDDHTQAGNDHTRAESDHTRAESDHAAVEVYVDSLGAFDISAYHATGGVLAEYADLTAALGTNGANVPDALRKGGMSVKFVQSSGHKYVQYRLMSDSFNITPANWQGVDSGSLISYDADIATRNTVLLNNAYTVSYTSAACRINQNGYYGTNTTYRHVYIPVVAGEKYHVDGIADYVLRIVFATTNEVTPGGAIPVVAGTSVIEIPASTNVWITIPEGCSYLLLWRNDATANFAGKVKKSNDFKFKSGENLNHVGICNYLDDTNTGLITKEAVRAYTDSMLDWLFIGKNNPVTASDTVNSKYLMYNNTTQDASVNFHIRTYEVKESCCYNIWGYRGGSDSVVFYLWLDENDNVISYNDALPKQKIMTRELVKAPAGAVKLRVQGHSDQPATCYEITARNQVLAIYAQNLAVSFTVDTITVSIGTLSVIDERGVSRSNTNLTLTTSGVSATIKWNPTDGLFAERASAISDNNTLILLRITNREVLGGLLYSQYIKDKEDADFVNTILSIPDSYKDIAEFIILTNKAISLDGSIITRSVSRIVGKFTVQGGTRYFLRGSLPSNTTETWYALYSNGNVVMAGAAGDGLFSHKAACFQIPSDVDTIYVGGTQNYPPQVFTIKDMAVGSGGVKTIYPLLTHDTIRQTNGEFSTNDNFANGFSKYTPRFIRLADNIKTFNVATSIPGNVLIFSYGSNFDYLGYQTVSIDTANTDVSVTLNYDATYIKVGQGTGNIAIPVIKLTGAFADNWDTFNPRPVNVQSGGSGSTVFAPGFRRISVLVNVTNPICCDSIKYVVSYDDGGTTAEAEGILSDVSELPSEGSSGIIYHIESGANAGFYMYINNSWTTVTIQHMLANDTQQLLPDYGMIALPETYTNTGKPTRLIIYCHGAAVNYSDSVRGFNTQDLKPAYWLAEGYAVMDIEGNPFNNTDEHCSMPQSIDSYVAGYKWAIEHFNLKRDGVFLGGRSMGGGQTVTLMRRECPIPIIAACPNVPAPAMPFGTTLERKTFWATHCGFILPDGFTFGNGYVEAEKPIYLSNWDKWIKYIALFSLITDLPISVNDKEEMIDKIWLGNVDERNDYLKAFHGYAKAPVKFFAINQDSGCLEYAKICYRMLLNSGQITELRILDSFKDYTGTGTSAHHADTQDPALRTTVTTRFGVEMTNVPIVYVEMLQFWRRYEQGN